MFTTQDVIAVIEQLSGHPLNRDEGVHHGRADRRVGGRWCVGWPLLTRWPPPENALATW